MSRIFAVFFSASSFKSVSLIKKSMISSSIWHHITGHWMKSSSLMIRLLNSNRTKLPQWRARWGYMGKGQSICFSGQQKTGVRSGASSQLEKSDISLNKDWKCLLWKDMIKELKTSVSSKQQMQMKVTLTWGISTGQRARLFFGCKTRHM